MPDVTIQAASNRTNPAGGTPVLSVIVPCFNERPNVAPMIAKLDIALAGIAWEVIYVDDNSPDGTAQDVRRIAQRDNRVRCIRRIGRRGLASAVIEGALSSSADYIAVIDGDLQHDETILPAMLDALQADASLDVAIGSRFAEGGGTGDWDRDRVAKSALATRLARHVLKAELSDPMSGFFMIRTEIVRALAPDLAGIGFKILLDIMTGSRRPLRFREFSYVFRNRKVGESKLDHVVAMEFLIALYDRPFGRYVPVRFAMFSAIGLLGVAVHMGVLSLLYLALGTTSSPGRSSPHWPR